MTRRNFLRLILSAPFVPFVPLLNKALPPPTALPSTALHPLGHWPVTKLTQEMIDDCVLTDITEYLIHNTPQEWATLTRGSVSGFFVGKRNKLD